MDELAGKSKSERKKARRRQRSARERGAGQELEGITDTAVEAALRLAPEVAAAVDQASSERLIDVPLATVDAARFIRKRVNEALAYSEYLDEIEAWVWEVDTSTRPPLGEAGSASGIELRLEQVSQSRQ